MNELNNHVRGVEDEMPDWIPYFLVLVASLDWADYYLGVQ
jgi:hypothetical protein